jgi:hypothetical protein
MQGAEILQYSLIAIVVISFTWIAARSRKLNSVLLWVLPVAFIPVVILNIVLPLETVKSELYWYWDTSSFLIKSLSLVTFTITLLLGASVSSWVVRVRWGKPIWLGVVSGVVAALILYVPAIIVGLFVACLSGDCL